MTNTTHSAAVHERAGVLRVKVYLQEHIEQFLKTKDNLYINRWPELIVCDFSEYLYQITRGMASFEPSKKSTP